MFAKWEGGGVGAGKCFCPSRRILLVTSLAGFFQKTIHHRSFFSPSHCQRIQRWKRREIILVSLGTQARNLKFSSSCFQVHQTEPYRLLLNFLFIYCHSTMFTLSVYFLNLYDIIRLQSFSQNKLRFEIKLTL